jgi:hypothetical protein
MCLTPEADHAVAAAAALHVNLRSVEEHSAKLGTALDWRRATPCRSRDGAAA